MSLGKRFICISIIYALLGMTLGIIMGMKNDFALMHLHAHINLIGWVAMAIFGLIYKAFPKMAANKIATFHFYLANIAAATQLVGIYVVLTSGFEPPVIIGSLLTVISMIIFFVNFIKNSED